MAWGVAIPVSPGAHAASEVELAGYEAGAWGTDCDAGGDVSVALGEHKTCTITNDDIAPQLTLTKVVINDDGGSAGPDDFGLSVDGSGVTSGATDTYLANTPLAIDETGLTGYSFVSISGDQVCPAALGGTVTLQPGDDVSCTITNDDEPSTLTLVKTVTKTTADRERGRLPGPHRR